MLGIQNVDFLATCAEITNQPKCKQIAFNIGDFRYHRFLETAWLAPKESNIYDYLTNRWYIKVKTGFG
jgi:hypothetical protein